MRIRAIAGVVTVTGALTGLAALSGPAASATTRPSCTRSALTAALRRDRTPSIRGGRIPSADRSFACAGRYATSGEIVGPRAHSVEITVLYRMAGGRWDVISRTTPCAKHWVPRRIYRAACESN